MQNTEISWNKGDILKVKAHFSEPLKGLKYGAMIVVANESGFSGGWDVFDAYGDNVSFYGFSVTRNFNA